MFELLKSEVLNICWLCKPPNWETAINSVFRTWSLVLGNVSQCSDSIPIWSYVECEIELHQFLIIAFSYILSKTCFL